MAKSRMAFADANSLIKKTLEFLLTSSTLMSSTNQLT